ncbi:MAG: NYN domain-containing protein [Alphaproteobacteria bacterium]|nr:NYN domain-containing protein [Alphaproteobacteria bacterium]
MTAIKHPAQRVGVFIDTQNLYHSARNLYKARVNFDSVVKYAVDGRYIVRALAYVITTESGEEANFLEALGEAGIETRSKELQIFHDNSKKADWDVGLAVDMISLAEKLDVIILISGDGDFIPALEYLKRKGCQIEVASFVQSTSQKLVECADTFIDLSLESEKFIFGYTPVRTSHSRQQKSPHRYKTNAPQKRRMRRNS